LAPACLEFSACRFRCRAPQRIAGEASSRCRCRCRCRSIRRHGSPALLLVCCCVAPSTGDPSRTAPRYCPDESWRIDNQSRAEVAGEASRAGASGDADYWPRDGPFRRSWSLPWTLEASVSPTAAMQRRIHVWIWPAIVWRETTNVLVYTRPARARVRPVLHNRHSRV
jgi:hypothetical protein